MLRISTLKSSENGTTLRLEGQITGPWMAELEQACERILGEHRTLRLDLGDVSLIDRPSVALLASLSRRSVALDHCSPFQAEQIRQATAADFKTDSTRP